MSLLPHRQGRSDLRVCASCEWVFRKSEQKDPDEGCPQCHFGHYSARYVYGDSAYRYSKTQKPWKDKKMAEFELLLNRTIREANEKSADLKKKPV